MHTLPTFWLPVLLSAVAVFLVSSLVHMVFKWHQSDYAALPNEDEVRRALNAPEPGQYALPHCLDPTTQEARERYSAGPVALFWIQKPGMPSLVKALGAWFLFNLVVAFLVAYGASRTLPTGAPFLLVLRVASTLAFLAYVVGAFPNAIWLGKPWKIAWKEALDGLLYALATGAVFGWLWPR